MVAETSIEPQKELMRLFPTHFLSDSIRAFLMFTFGLADKPRESAINFSELVHSLSEGYPA